MLRELNKKIDIECRSTEERTFKDFAEICDIRRGIEAQEIEDYVFISSNGVRKRLSEYIREKDRLFIVHNMGVKCRYCAVYADGINAVYDQLSEFGQLILVSPDAVDTMAEFGRTRGWRFNVASIAECNFSYDMNLQDEGGSPFPGLVIVELSEGKPALVAKYGFEPGDHFSPLWPILQMAGISEEEADPYI